MSHGGKNVLYGKDGKAVEYDEIYRSVGTYNFPAMSGKPRIIILQACAGGKHIDIEY